MIFHCNKLLHAKHCYKSIHFKDDIWTLKHCLKF
nr:MAG TPA: hypothetical protein [Caudoviricetes sp.]